MAGGEPEQRLDQRERRRVELEQAVLEIQPEVRRDLVVAGAAGVQPLPAAGDAAGEPVLDRGVDVLLRWTDGEPAGVYRRQGPSQSPAQPLVVGDR